MRPGLEDAQGSNCARDDLALDPRASGLGRGVIGEGGGLRRPFRSGLDDVATQPRGPRPDIAVELAGLVYEVGAVNRAFGPAEIRHRHAPDALRGEPGSRNATGMPRPRRKLNPRRDPADQAAAAPVAGAAQSCTTWPGATSR